MITRAIDFALVILIARVLGPADMGHLSVINSVLALVLILAAFGLPQAVTKYVAETGDARVQSAVFRSSLKGALLLSVVSVLLLLFVLHLTHLIKDSVAVLYLRLLAFVIPLLTFLDLALHYLWGRAEMKRKAALDVAIKFGYAAFVLAFIFPLKLRGVVLAKVANPVVWTIVLLFVVARRLERPAGDVDSRRLYRFGAFTSLAELASSLIRNFDILTLSYFLADAASIGMYRVAALLAINLDIAFEAVVHTYYPDISRLTNDRAAMRRLFWKLVAWAILIMIPVSFLAFMFAPVVLKVLFGASYAGAVGAFRILVFVPLIYAVLRVFGNTFSGTGRPDISFAIVLFAGASNLALNLILVPRLGILGAAVALVCTHLLNLLVSSAVMYFYLFRGER